MTALVERDLLQVLDVLDVGRTAPPAAGRLPGDVLAALHTAVPSDNVSFCDLDVSTCTFHVLDGHDGSGTATSGQPESAPQHPFWQHYEGSRFCSYPTDTGNHRSVTMRGDFFSLPEWRRTTMYATVFAADGITDELLCPLTSRGPRSRRVLFSRCGGSGFTERDRLVLVLLRPHLAELVAPSPQPAGDLTPRQTELMRLVAAGRSNSEIAVALVVSPHTVRTHLENIFERLQVTSRTAAVARAFG
jgi:DNA-binding CsgD family transcriptional regulator